MELKDFEVERGYTKQPPIPYIPVEDEVGELVIKASRALEYKLELLGGTKASRALWESGSVETFLKHVMSAMSYVTQKRYFVEYKEAKREHGRAVYEAKLVKNLWLAVPEPPEGTESPELTAVKDTEKKIIIANLKALQ